MRTKKLQDKIKAIDTEIEFRQKLIANAIMDSFSNNKCEYCGISNGIHKSDCLFITRHC